MQGTIVMMLALSGLGCHHKSCGPAYVPACYSSCYSGATAARLLRRLLWQCAGLHDVRRSVLLQRMLLGVL